MTQVHDVAIDVPSAMQAMTAEMTADMQAVAAEMTADVQAVAADVQAITAELVAKAVAGLSQIGHARAALEKAGWKATIVANRITVNGLIEALLVLSNGAGWWHVHSVDGAPPIWTVGAHPSQEDSSSSWIGCVE